ncbi:MAG TPA: ATP-binding cassette domain-containing protein, partial [Trueperaceae bacterium]|nr:ATP-binding cassette domain-containing protein [Trueperaceae bacterium]
TDARALANLMVGRDTIAVSRNTEHEVDEQVLFAVKGLSLSNKRGIKVLKNLSFNIHGSEIVGIAGVAGNGQTELLEVLNGLKRPNTGEAILDNQKLSFADSQLYNSLKIGRIPEDRHKATIADLTVAENLVLEHIEDFSKAGHLSNKAIKQYAQKLIKDFQIKAKANDKARTLSGGNLQKLILARTLAREPRLIIVAQPTRGVDVGASEYVHQKLLEQKRNGAAILLISDDLDEVMRLSDRILVIYEGEFMAEFKAEDASREVLGLLMAGQKDVA